MVKKFLMGGVALLSLSSIAAAADLNAYPNKAPAANIIQTYNWTGLYFGLDAGGAFAAQPLEINSIGVTAQGIGQSFNPGILGPSATGAVGGGWVGFNYQLNPAFVLGVEVDAQATGLSSTGTSALNQMTFTAAIPWQVFAEAKLGWLVQPNLMLSVHGGAAMAEIKENAMIAAICGVGACTQDFDNVHTGWTVGAGIDWMITNSLGVRLKYNYVDLGTQGVTFTNIPGITASFDNNATAKYNQATAGLFLHF